MSDLGRENPGGSVPEKSISGDVHYGVNKCIVCSQPAKNRCAWCGKGFYRTKECQTLDWKRCHHLTCARMKGCFSGLHLKWAVNKNLYSNCEVVSDMGDNRGQLIKVNMSPKELKSKVSDMDDLQYIQFLTLVLQSDPNRKIVTSGCSGEVLPWLAFDRSAHKGRFVRMPAGAGKKPEELEIARIMPSDDAVVCADGSRRTFWVAGPDSRGRYLGMSPEEGLPVRVTLREWKGIFSRTVIKHTGDSPLESVVTRSPLIF